MATPLPAPVAAKAVLHAATVHDVVAQSATAANLNVYIVAAIITATAVIVSQLLNAGISALREYRSRIRREGRVKQVFISLVLEIDRLLSMVVNDRLLVDPEQVETQSQALREALADLTPLLDLDPLAIHSLYTLVGSIDRALGALRPRFAHARSLEAQLEGASIGDEWERLLAWSRNAYAQSMQNACEALGALGYFSSDVIARRNARAAAGDRSHPNFRIDGSA